MDSPALEPIPEETSGHSTQNSSVHGGSPPGHVSLGGAVVDVEKATSALTDDANSAAAGPSNFLSM